MSTRSRDQATDVALCNKAIRRGGVVVWMWVGSVGETVKWDNTPHSKKHAPHTCTALLQAHACCAAEATIAFHRPVPRPRKDHLQSVGRLTILSYPICAELVVQ